MPQRNWKLIDWCVLHLVHVPHPSRVRGGGLRMTDAWDGPGTRMLPGARGARSLSKMDALSFRVCACRTRRPDPPTLRH